MGPLAKLRLLVAHLGALAVAWPLELYPDALRGHLGDHHLGGAGGLQHLAGSLQVGGRRHPDRDRRGRRAIAGRVVEEDAGHDLLVRDHHQPPVAGVDVGVGQRQVVDPAAVLPDRHRVADPDRLGDGDQDPGDEVGQRLAGCEADHQAEHGAGGEDPGGEPLELREAAQRQGGADHQDDHEQQATDEPQPGLRRARQRPLAHLRGHVPRSGDRQAVDGERDRDRNRHRDHGRDQVAVLAPEARRQNHSP